MLLKIALATIALGSLAGCGGIALEPSDAGPSNRGSSSSSGSSVSGSTSSGSTSGSSTGVSSSGGTTFDAGSFDDVTVGDDSSTVGVDCGVTPSLHQNPAGTIYCGLDGTGMPIQCSPGMQCCLGGPLGGGMYAPEECDPWSGSGAGCMNPATGGAIGIACNQISDCVANGFTGTLACCLQGATTPASPAGCSFLKATHGSAIVCEDIGDAGVSVGGCAAGEVQICSADADCPAGMQCVPGKWKIFEVGFCQ